MLQRAGASAAARYGAGQLLLFPLLDVPLPTCTRWHGARMHDAQPVLTRLPARPITQGSAHAHHDSRAASLVPSKVPAARRAGLHVAAVPIISLAAGRSLVQSHAVAACRVAVHE